MKTIRQIFGHNCENGNFSTCRSEQNSDSGFQFIPQLIADLPQFRRIGNVDFSGNDFDAVYIFRFCNHFIDGAAG